MNPGKRSFRKMWKRYMSDEIPEETSGEKEEVLIDA